MIICLIFHNIARLISATFTDGTGVADFVCLSVLASGQRSLEYIVVAALCHFDRAVAEINVLFVRSADI